MAKTVKSCINKNEMVANKDQHVAADAHYLPCYVRALNGYYVPALFTEEQLKVAMDRATKNPEDIPERAGWVSRMFSQLFS